MEIEKIGFNVLKYDTLKVDTSMISINLSDIMRSLKSYLTFSKTSIMAVPLLNEPEKKIIITAAHGNADIRFLPSDNSVSLQVIEGVLVYRSRKESVTLNPGMMLTVGENMKFRIKTVDKTLFLLTLVCPSGNPNAGLN